MENDRERTGTRDQGPGTGVAGARGARGARGRTEAAAAPVPGPRSPVPASAPILEVLAGLDHGTLTRFLLARRWYGGKGRAPKAVRVDGFVPLPWLDGRCGIARLRVEGAEGRATHHQLPLAYLPAGELPADGPRAVLVRHGEGAQERVLFDATEDARFRAELARAFEIGARFEGGGTLDGLTGNARWVVEPTAEGLRLPESSRVGSAEQSNTSILYGDRAILKLFRRLEPGENPDVEIGRFLTAGDERGASAFPHTPALLGTIRLEDESGSAVAGMLQTLVPGSRDAWAHVLERGRAWFGASPTARLGAPEVADDAERLGRVTRALHEALAAGRAAEHEAFRPEPATGDDVERWAEGAREMLEEGFDLLEERLDAGALPAERVAEARALVERHDAFLAYIEELADAAHEDAGLRIRHHGDSHLGQVLRSGAGDFLVIDFEGEPARALEERRRKHSPLRDVAGMLRSFAYAAATLAQERRGTLEPRVLEPRTAQWERSARASFLRGYHAGGGEGSRVLPRSRGATDALVALFETEKVFYELAYELNNRPDWTWIPMRGISRLLYRPETK